jgi:hypothetical protein
MPALPKALRTQLEERGCKPAPKVSNEALNRLKELSHTFVHQVKSSALNGERGKILSMADVDAAMREFLNVYTWIDTVDFINKVQKDMFGTTPTGKKKINTLGTILVKDVETMLKGSTHKATRDVSAFFLRAADEFVMVIVLKSVSLRKDGSASLDCTDIDNALF